MDSRDEWSLRGIYTAVLVLWNHLVNTLEQSSASSNPNSFFDLYIPKSLPELKEARKSFIAKFRRTQPSLDSRVSSVYPQN